MLPLPPGALHCSLAEGRERACASSPAVSPLLHVGVCVSCEFSATSSHRGGRGGAVGTELWALWEQPPCCCHGAWFSLESLTLLGFSLCTHQISSKSLRA